MSVCDQAEALRNELPALLSQEYDGLDVVVVDDGSTDETKDLLSDMKSDHSHLYTTFVPQYHFRRNARRLAFTIGMKAAKGQWLVFTDITTLPPSPTWVQELADCCTPSTDLLVGYIRRKTGDVRLKTYDDISQARSLISKTEQRRSHGKKHLLDILHHDYDFLVVRADKGNELLRFFDTAKTQRL